MFAQCNRFFVAVSVLSVQTYKCIVALLCLFVSTSEERSSRDKNNSSSNIHSFTLTVHKKAFHNTILIHLNGTNRFHIQYFGSFFVSVRVSFCFLFAANDDNSTCVNAFSNCAFAHTLRLSLFLSHSVYVSVTQ